MRSFYLTLVLMFCCASYCCAMEEYDLEEFSVHSLYQQGDLQTFRRVVQKFDLDLDEPNAHGLCLVHLAAMKGQIEWLALLYSLGADFAEVDRTYEWPPISWALFSQKAMAFQMLKNFGNGPLMAQIALPSKKPL